MNYAIIAAGEGSRLAAEGVSLPKPLVELGGKPMIGRLIDIFTGCGAESVSVIVNEQMTEVQDYLRALAPQLPVPLRLVVKSTPSSMHSFAELSTVMGRGRFILTTVDTIFRAEDFRRYVAAFQQAPEADGCMAVTSYIDDEKPLYVDVNADMEITAFRDASRPGDDRFISAGIYGLDDRAFATLHRCMDAGVSRMRNFQRALLDDGLRLKAFDMGRVLDVDHAEDLRKAREFVAG